MSESDRRGNVDKNLTVFQLELLENRRYDGEWCKMTLMQ